MEKHVDKSTTPGQALPCPVDPALTPALAPTDPSRPHPVPLWPPLAGDNAGHRSVLLTASY